MKRVILFFTITAFVAGCASQVISRDLRDKAEEDIPLSVIFSNPDNYKGKIVILRGMIIRSHNKQEGIYIEVLEIPQEHHGIQEYTDLSFGSHGKFFILLEGYHNPDIFYEDRKIIVAGEVMGRIHIPSGEKDSPSLLLKSRELHLLDPEEGFIQFGTGMWDGF